MTRQQIARDAYSRFRWITGLTAVHRYRHVTHLVFCLSRIRRNITDIAYFLTIHKNSGRIIHGKAA